MNRCHSISRTRLRGGYFYCRCLLCRGYTNSPDSGDNCQQNSQFHFDFENLPVELPKLGLIQKRRGISLLSLIPHIRPSHCPFAWISNAKVHALQTCTITIVRKWYTMICIYSADVFCCRIFKRISKLRSLMCRR